MSDETPAIDVPVTEVPPTETPVTEPPVQYLFDIDALVTDHDRLLQKEAEDRAIANTVENPDPIAFKTKLVEWASKGFPDSYPVFSVTITPPTVCSDGVTRDVSQYFEFLTGVSAFAKADTLTAKLKGMCVECSFPYENTFKFFVRRV
jgi:hypothetical protein